MWMFKLLNKRGGWEDGLHTFAYDVDLSICDLDDLPLIGFLLVGSWFLEDFLILQRWTFVVESIVVRIGAMIWYRF